MTDIFEWKKVPERERKIIADFVNSNAPLVNEFMRKNHPDIYIGRRPEEMVRGWTAVAGLNAVMDFIENES